jgi:hypothetical protein
MLHWNVVYCTAVEDAVLWRVAASESCWDSVLVLANLSV